MVHTDFNQFPLEQPAPDHLNLSIQAERERIANHLHDSMAQDLTFVHSQAAAIRILLTKGEINRALEKIQLLEEISQNLSGDIRSLIGQLNNIEKVAPGLDVALRVLTESFSRRCQIPVYYKVQSADVVTGLSPQVSFELYNIVQEALTNVCKHATANAVWVQLLEKEMCFDVIIRDDGCGFQTKNENDLFRNHFGLSIMQARARRVGARLKIEEPEDYGAQITVCIPHNYERQI